MRRHKTIKFGEVVRVIVLWSTVPSHGAASQQSPQRRSTDRSLVMNNSLTQIIIVGVKTLHDMDISMTFPTAVERHPVISCARMESHL